MQINNGNMFEYMWVIVSVTKKNSRYQWQTSLLRGCNSKSNAVKVNSSSNVNSNQCPQTHGQCDQNSVIGENETKRSVRWIANKVKESSHQVENIQYGNQIANGFRIIADSDDDLSEDEHQAVLDAVGQDVLGILHNVLVPVGRVQSGRVQSSQDDVVDHHDDPAQLKGAELECEYQTILDGRQRDTGRRDIDIAQPSGEHDDDKDERARNHECIELAIVGGHIGHFLFIQFRLVDHFGWWWLKLNSRIACSTNSIQKGNWTENKLDTWVYKLMPIVRSIDKKEKWEKSQLLMANEWVDSSGTNKLDWPVYTYI